MRPYFQKSREWRPSRSLPSNLPRRGLPSKPLLQHPQQCPESRSRQSISRPIRRLPLPVKPRRPRRRQRILQPIRRLPLPAKPRSRGRHPGMLRWPRRSPSRRRRPPRPNPLWYRHPRLCLPSRPALLPFPVTLSETGGASRPRAPQRPSLRERAKLLAWRRERSSPLRWKEILPRPARFRFPGLLPSSASRRSCGLRNPPSVLP